MNAVALFKMGASRPDHRSAAVKLGGIAQGIHGVHTGAVPGHQVAHPVSTEVFDYSFRSRPKFCTAIMKILAHTLFLAFLALAAFEDAGAQFIQGRDLLGTEVIDEKSKRGNVRLSRGIVAYSGLQIEVTGGAEVVKRVTVRFEDRSSESFHDSRLALRNGRSDVLWFRSQNQALDRISLLYVADAGQYSGTEIRVYGVR